MICALKKFPIVQTAARLVGTGQHIHHMPDIDYFSSVSDAKPVI
jgi:hypothetical protein